MKYRRALLTALLAAVLAASLQGAKDKVKLPPKYDEWLKKEVLYIITDEEKKEFLQLTTDADRDKYIETFWNIRNPVRGSEHNLYKEEHYKRLEYATEHFGRMSNTPGWMTDMGRTWILFGKPQSQGHYIGYSQIYPLELWFYQNSSGSPSLPSFFYLLFYMPEDIGEYRYYRPYIDGPMKLVRGSQFNANQDVYRFLRPLSGELARAVFTLVPGEPIDTETYSPSMTSDVLISRIQNFANDSFNLKRLREARYLQEKVNSWFLVTQEQSIEVSYLVLADPLGNHWLDFGALIHSEMLGHLDPTGKQLIVNSGYRLSNEAGDLIVEDAEGRAYPAFDDEKKFRPFVIANRVPVVPGTYKLEVDVVNREAGRSFKGERVIKVGTASSVTMSDPMLVASARQAANPDPITPFQYYGVQFVPAADRQFTSRDQLLVLFQLHQPQSDAQDFDVEYLIAHTQNRDLRRTVTDKIAGSEFHNGTLLKSKTLGLADLETGNYRLVINLHPVGSPQVLASTSTPLRVVGQGGAPALFFFSNVRNISAPGVAPYIRGLEALGQKDEISATEFLRQALDQNPGNTFAGQTLVQLYYDKQRFDQVVALYSRHGIEFFKATPETLAQVALSLWRTGDSDRAKRVVQAAEGYFPKHQLLLAAARQIEQPPAKTATR